MLCASSSALLGGLKSIAFRPKMIFEARKALHFGSKWILTTEMTLISLQNEFQSPK